MINSEHYPRNGKIDWIGIRPAKKQPLNEVASAYLDPTHGIDGDHYSGKSGKRHVTLIQAEHIPVIAALVGKESIDPLDLRRNLVVSGINLHSLHHKRIGIGNDVLLEVTGDCHPCSRMEENLGHGGWNAMRGMGGITAKIIIGGKIEVGDKVRFISAESTVD